MSHRRLPALLIVCISFAVFAVACFAQNPYAGAADDRDSLAKTGAAIRDAFARGDIDAASIRGLDDVADLLHGEHPEAFIDHEDKTGRLFELLAEGNPEPVNIEDTYRQAIDQLMAYRRESVA